MSEPGSERGAVVLAQPASGRLGLTAGTQLETVVPSGSELITHQPALEQAALAGLELCSWSEALGNGERRTRVGIAPARGPEPVFTALAGARELISRARAGCVSLEEEAAGRLALPWLATTEEGNGLVSLRWAGPGVDGETAGGSPPGSRARPIIGRRDELTEIASRWSEASLGERRLLLIAGEPGSGKTRLVGEAAHEIARAGGRVLYGVGEEPETIPYAPFITALSDGEDDGSPSFAELAGGSAVSGQPASAGLGNERSALFSAAVSELERRCRKRPVALVIEDLHCCGSSSLQLVRHLARSPHLRRLLIVGTYRPTDLDPDSPEAALVAGLRAEASASHLELGPLSPRALRGLAASFGVDPGVVDRVGDLAEHESGGLALYACELIRTIAEGGRVEEGANLPRSLQVLISSRAHGLGPDVHAQLSVASVAGTSFDPAIVAAACELPAVEFAEVLGRAERSGLVRRDPSSDRYAFGHALTARCMYQELSPDRRAAVHGRLAAAMERAAESAEAVEPGRIAHHWERAEPPEHARAGRWAALAADRALARFDPDAATRWYEHALELYDRVRPEDSARRCDLLLGLGAALRLGGSARFREVLLQAARLALELDDTDRLVSAVLTNNRGFVSAIGEFDRERLAMLELAAERVTDVPRRALVLAQLALELTFSPERERRHELAEQSLRLARGVGEPQLLVRVLNRNLISRWEPGNARERIKLANESIKIGGGLDDPLDLFHGLHWRAAAELEACEIDGAHRSINEQARIASRLGDPTADWLTACSQCQRFALRGRLREAEEAAEHAATMGRTSDQPDALPFYASQIASIRWQQGRLHELAPLLDAALEHHPGLPAFRSLVALARAAAGNEDGVREVIAIDRDEGFSKLPRDPTWLAGTVTYAHAVAEVGDVEAAETLLELLMPLRGLLATTSVSAWGLTDQALGRLAATLGDEEAAIDHLDRAIREYARFPAPIWRGQAMVDLATVLRRANRDPSRRDGLLAEAREIGLRHGARLLVAGAAEDGSAERSHGAEPGSLQSLSERLAALNLTKRQRDIVVLIARGMTNAEVAEELMLSPSTVKRHLENAFRRSGVRGRKGLMAKLYE